MNKHHKPRQSERMPVSMNFLSTNLPTSPAELVNLSDGGCKIRLSQAPGHNLQNACISAKVTLPCNSQALFEGAARVIWVQEVQDGVDIGLQWTAPTSNSWKVAKAMLLGD